MAELGPNEGINALRHPDCRFCNEYEMLIKGVKLERDQARKQALLEVAEEFERIAGEHEATVADHGMAIVRDWHEGAERALRKAAIYCRELAEKESGDG